MGGEISRQDMKIKAKFICVRLIPSKNEKGFYREADILIYCLPTMGIGAPQIRRKAWQKTLSMPFSFLVGELCVHFHVRYLSLVVASPSIGVIDVDYKEPKINNHKIGDQYFTYDTPDRPTPAEPKHAAIRQVTTPGGTFSQLSSNQSAYHTLMELNYSNEYQLKALRNIYMA